MDIDFLSVLNKMVQTGEHKEILRHSVMEIGGRAVSEEEVLRRELIHMSTIRIAERDIALPGLGNPIFQELAVAFVARSRSKWVRPFRPFWLASVNDMTVLPLCRPELLGPTGRDNWRQTIAAAGIVEIWPQAEAGWFGLDDKKEAIFITDFVEFSPTPIVTALSMRTDGDLAKIHEIRQYMKMSNLQVYKMPSPAAATVNLDIDAKAEFAGETELTPFGLYVCTGDMIPALT